MGRDIREVFDRSVVFLVFFFFGQLILIGESTHYPSDWGNDINLLMIRCCSKAMFKQNKALLTTLFDLHKL